MCVRRLSPQVAHVRRALLLADWGDPSHEQSLQNPKNARLARTAVDNLREACNVAGRRGWKKPKATCVLCASQEQAPASIVASEGEPTRRALSG